MCGMHLALLGGNKLHHVAVRAQEKAQVVAYLKSAFIISRHQNSGQLLPLQPCHRLCLSALALFLP